MTVETAEERVRAERAAQGLPTPAAPIGEAVADACIAAAYRTTATLLASAIPATSDHAPASVDEGVAGFGAAGPRDTGTCGEVGPNVGQTGNRRPAAPTTKRRPAVRAAGLQDNAG